MKQRTRTPSHWLYLTLLFTFVLSTSLHSEPQKTTTSLESPELRRQHQKLLADLKNQKTVNRYPDQLFNAAAGIANTDRDPLDIVLRRTTTLLKNLNTVEWFSEFEAELTTLSDLAKKTSLESTTARYDIYERACKLRRRIAFSNPLLDFDKLLFIKRHRATYNHMCDQFYGINARPGGSLFVLNDVFGDSPTATDLLSESIVQSGRLKGTRLNKGSFLSPDLSYDGNNILFAYTECHPDKEQRHHTDSSKGHWHQENSFHIFNVNSDGSNLKQITDGTFNDFDPCFMPNGRVVFISERRGGYLRCGRACPTYTLFDMKPDGSNINMLSAHENNEWQPSIAHSGEIVYTRWDYIDRHGCTAHAPWITSPDGRDTRSVHGNYATKEKRPDMEMDVRAIPGSHRFIATAAPHHGQAFGSLVMVDPRVADDDAMAPVKRITPEVPFPESEAKKSHMYGSAWPLSENYYLCVYDDKDKFNHGLYLLDAFGNKELLYRDAEIASLSPMPFRPRPSPRLMPNASARSTPEEQPKTGVMGVINVYDSLKPWPEGTKITALRIMQMLPSTVPSGFPPHEIGLRIKSAPDSITMARQVLGTVPVETDGSAHFIVPAMRELSFQALNKEGLAVQGMRSAAYVQPGEVLVCHGCHEPKTSTPSSHLSPAKALQRPPSTIKPDVAGSKPFSYPILVQPVLDKKCVSCHAQHSETAPPLDSAIVRDGRKIWYQSYWSLTPKFGFYDYGDRYRTTPGKFGAMTSKLYKMLNTGHHGVNLSKEELHRITLWLDSGSIFYGVYEKEGGEAQLQGKVALPTLE